MEMSCSMSNDEIISIKKRIAWNQELDKKYELHLCKTGEFRMKLKDRRQVEEFINDWKQHANVTWRVFRTFPGGMAGGLKNIYYKEFHCQSSNTCIRPRTQKPHVKHSDCKAKMIVTIKKTNLKRRGAPRSKDKHLPVYPTIVRIHNVHNHALDSADNLRFKDVCIEVKNKFIKLFEDGHTPSSALDKHKIDLKVEHIDDYSIVAADRSKCPDLQWCYRLCKSIRTKNLKEYNVSQLSKKKLSGTDEIMDITPSIKKIHRSWVYNNEIVVIDTIDGETGELEFIQAPLMQSLPPTDQAPDEERINSVHFNLNIFNDYIKCTSKTINGLQASETFFKNFLNMKTDASIHSAMYDFGKIDRNSTENINVQHTSYVKNEIELGGKKDIAGDPGSSTITSYERNVAIPFFKRKIIFAEFCSRPDSEYKKCVNDHSVFTKYLACRPQQRCRDECLNQYIDDEEIERKGMESYLEERKLFRETGLLKSERDDETKANASRQILGIHIKKPEEVNPEHQKLSLFKLIYTLLTEPEKEDEKNKD